MLIPMPDVNITNLDQLHTPIPVVRTAETMGLLPKDPWKISFHIGVVNKPYSGGSALEYALGLGKRGFRFRVFYSQRDGDHNSQFIVQEGGGLNSGFSSEIIRKTSQHMDFKHVGVDATYDITDSVVGVLGFGQKTINGDTGVSTETITHFLDGEEFDSITEESPINPFQNKKEFLRVGGGINLDFGDAVEFEILGLVHLGSDRDSYYVIDVGGAIEF